MIPDGLVVIRSGIPPKIIVIRGIIIIVIK
jgi:hypothetical protein